MTQYFMSYNDLQNFINILQKQGYDCIGPQIREGCIIYESLSTIDQLPWGWMDEQQPGSYHLMNSTEKKAFYWANGPQALKPFLFKARETVWRAERGDTGRLEFKPFFAEEAPIAFIGARACDLAAMTIQDKVFLGGKYPDPHYKRRREALFVVAVNCITSSSNCFCVSAGTGPQAKNAFDVALTEIEGGFITEIGSDRGRQIIQQLQLSHAPKAECIKAKEQIISAAEKQTKKIPFDNQIQLRDRLFANLQHPRWDEVAERCLSCTNCTAVCPTCFCHSENDKPELSGTSSEHQREWDSCFTAGHSFLAGKPIRPTTKDRYRQWLTHKVGSWFDQFGSSGCVGCGRCMTWCPVGIDITEELVAICGDTKDIGV